MTHLTKSRQILGFVMWLAITFVAAGIGAVASAEAGIFFRQLSRPVWAPPAWLFAPVWTVLYLLMGVAAWLIWRVGGFRAARTALSLFFIQLAANALWTWIFFVWKLGALAFVEILVLWVLILFTIIAFWRIRKLAGILLFPYLAWVSFASILTFTIWKFNPLFLS